MRRRYKSLPRSLSEDTMDNLFWNIDWQAIFTPTKSLAELVARGKIM